MKYPLLSKEEFCNCIEGLKKLVKKEKILNKAFKDLDEQADIMLVGLFTSENHLIRNLLAKIMQATVIDKYGSTDIDYFCDDLDFGESYVPGSILDKDGSEIVLRTSEDLYEYLVREHSKKS